MKYLLMVTLLLSTTGCFRHTGERETFDNGLSNNQKAKIVDALERNTKGEITDGDVVEVSAAIHRQAMSRIRSDKIMMVMEKERFDAQAPLRDWRNEKIIRLFPKLFKRQVKTEKISSYEYTTPNGTRLFDTTK